MPKKLKSINSREQRDRDVLANDGLVGMTAKIFYRGGVVVDYDDLKQVGRIGLMRASELHDGSKTKFSTYAISAIRSHMAYENTKNFELHRTKQSLIQAARVRDAMAAIKKETGFDPDPKEAAARAGFKGSTLKTAVAAYKASLITSICIDAMKEHDTTSLAVAHSDSPDGETIEVLQKCLCEIPVDDSELICRFYGIFGYEQTSIVEQAAELGISRQAAWERKRIAMKRLRAAMLERCA